MLDNAYCGPVIAAAQLTQKLEEFGYTNEARIIDLGCGTGLVGEQLHKLGYKNIDGVDLSPDLLQTAKEKGIYGSLQEGLMASPGCKDLGVAANQYDAAICVGVLTLNHVPSEGLNDLVHVVKPGGLVTFGIRGQALDAAKGRYQEKMDQLSKEGKWKFIAKKYEPVYLKDDNAWFFVYQIL